MTGPTDGGARSPAGGSGRRRAGRGPGGSRNGGRPAGSAPRPRGQGGAATPRSGQPASRGASRSRSPADQRARRSPADQRARRSPADRKAAVHSRPPHLHAHEVADAENQARVRANHRRGVALAAAAAAVPAVAVGAVTGAAAGPVAGAAAAAGVWVVAAWVVVAGALHIALALVGAVPVGADRFPALATQVEGLSATIGVGMPEVWLLDDAAVNACALAGRGRIVLVVTAGVLDRLERIEREGVLAHELVHMKRGDAGVSALALATAGLLAWATGRDGLVHAAVGGGREYEADRAAVLAVRYPPGLHGALAAMSASAARRADDDARHAAAAVPGSRRWAATRWIWIDPMAGATERARVGELDATDVRMAALGER